MSTPAGSPPDGTARPPFALFENNLSAPAQAILLEDLEEALEARSADELENAFHKLEQARSKGWWVALAADYELGYLLETSAHPGFQADRPLLRAWIYRRKRTLSGHALEQWWEDALTRLSPQQAEAGLLQLTPEWSEAQHAAACQRILDYIHAGDCYQVNLTFPLHGESFGHPLALFARLRETQSVAHGALIFDGKDWILSRSPELFLRKQGPKLGCRPMKGTARRSQDPQEDQRNALALQQSVKDRAENLMIVDLIRNDLGRLSPPGGVRVERLFELETYPSLFQLTSSISAEPVSASLHETLRALFPCGSITGAPKIRAMQIIREVEASPRGLYCGALGWLAPNGDFSLNVPIRTLLVSQNGQCRLNVGSGIVADSAAHAEYRECLLKADFLRKLQNETGLIETLRREADGSYPHLEGHLQRLARSAQALHIACDPAGVRQALQRFSTSLPASPQRVRLQLDRPGNISLQAFPLEPPPPHAEFALAHWQLDPLDPRLAHKSTARSFYDQALRQANKQGLFDIVFCNTRGELCEGARSNIFLEINGELLTPALSSGLLPGVLRAALIDSGQARACVLHESDLHRATRIWLGNALRGLIEAHLRP